jgi:iron complex outermembrane receptor protein
MGLDNVDLFKVRLGYGVTGALPQQSGLSQPIRAVVNGADGSVTTDLIRAGNDSLRWERKSEINFGVEFQSGRFSSTLDLYTRDISDFILERTVDPAVFVVNRRFENVGELNTRGVELALNYDVVQGSDFNYTTGVILSTYRTKLNEYVLDAETRANLGAPGQNGTNMILVREGEEIGNIWGPVFESVAEDGSPVFSDLNNDGMLLTDQALALDSLVDFAVLGNGIPDLTFGWTNQISFKGWNINAFFRGAIGHSLVNTFRAFYEPQLSTQSSYNFVNTDLAVDGLTSARFSSLYVEKADFIRLDNLTISRSVNIPGNSIRNATVSLNLQNPFVITSYTGTDPEPSLVDSGAADNGNRDFINVSDVLSPGIERRNSYFASRSVTLGINLNF